MFTLMEGDFHCSHPCVLVVYSTIKVNEKTTARQVCALLLLKKQLDQSDGIIPKIKDYSLFHSIRKRSLATFSQNIKLVVFPP